MPKKSGFTLIELLIAISIIAILSVIGLGMYGSVYKSSRDAKRKSDIKFIQSALEDYHADQIYYPSTVTPGSALKNPSNTKTYSTEVPKDPSGSPEYSYVASGTDCIADTPQNCTSYCIYAKLEMPSSTVFVGDSVCSSGAGSYNYGLTRP